ncbi:hypothetical protein [Parafilimonas sp.]|uniref:hypothetical protein n=1 Tax=Parafilimonas sp. TaxID=1969739 RepID=UPI003F7EF5DB
MKHQVVHIFPSDDFLNNDNTRISFKKFVEFLNKKAKEDDSLKSKFFKFVLKHFKRYPELLEQVSIYDLKHYSNLFNLLEGVVLPHLANEKDFALALGVPFNPIFFLETEAFNHLLHNKSFDVKMEFAEERKELIQFRQLKKKYELILERLYDFQPLVQEEMVHARTDTETHLTRYFNLSIDNRFVEIEYTGELPEINISQVQQQLSDIDSLKELEKILPLSMFSFSGFSIITTKDITARHALHKMRSAIIKHDPDNYNTTYGNIIELLMQLCGRPHITFGLLPFLKLNDRLVSYYGNYAHSILINISKKLNIPESTFVEWINKYYEHPKTLIKKECDFENKHGDGVYRAFRQMGYAGYIIIPVFYNNEVAGVLEIGSKHAEMIDDNLVSRIDAAIPILGQLMHQTHTDFAANIINVIRQNFTAIQSSVLWKFNEVAWNYIKNANADSLRNMEEIRFDHLHPLYGAIDIRNSTIERNNALHKDMRYYFKMVKSFLKQLHIQDEGAVNMFTNEANSFLELPESSFTGNEETLMDNFMEKLNTWLNKIEEDEIHNKNLINNYYRDIDIKHGKAYKNRRILENSMQCINFIISDHFSRMQEELQKKYPIYFEKIRTDGIEYDMYLGQSISPQKPYQKTFLNELRFLQLENMAAVAKLVHASAKSLPVPLQTTQLIYVNASSIAITFRMDEKRFDVEGGYNIRYHIIKKRIDKVLVKQTGERLTQPGKLAIIYTQPQHEKEYMEYIKELQKRNVLKPAIELLELEQLQGVKGLKAIRAAVNLGA